MSDDDIIAQLRAEIRYLRTELQVVNYCLANAEERLDAYKKECRAAVATMRELAKMSAARKVA